MGSNLDQYSEDALEKIFLGVLEETSDDPGFNESVRALAKDAKDTNIDWKKGMTEMLPGVILEKYDDLGESPEVNEKFIRAANKACEKMMDKFVQKLSAAIDRESAKKN